MDREVEALRRLLHATDADPGGSVERRRAVALRAGCSPDNLYQVARGIPLKSGRPRRIGRDVRERLDAAFPGWMEVGAASFGVGDDAAGAKTAPALSAALPVVLEALRKLPRARRAALAADWAALLSAPDSAELQSAVLAALAAPNDAAALGAPIAPEHLQTLQQFSDEAEANHGHSKQSHRAARR